jgi:hypothetical protein
LTTETTTSDPWPTLGNRNGLSAHTLQFAH